ncbi:hypothetical protein SRHO_G00325720 [Serrasalmus rhombeus]
MCCGAAVVGHCEKKLGSWQRPAAAGTALRDIPTGQRSRGAALAWHGPAGCLFKSSVNPPLLLRSSAAAEPPQPSRPSQHSVSLDAVWLFAYSYSNSDYGETSVFRADGNHFQKTVYVVNCLAPEIATENPSQLKMCIRCEGQSPRGLRPSCAFCCREAAPACSCTELRGKTRTLPHTGLTAIELLLLSAPDDSLNRSGNVKVLRK